VLVLSHYTALLFRVQPAVSLWFPPSGVAITLSLWFGLPAVLMTGLVSTLIAPIWGSHGWTQWAGLADAVEPLIAWWLYRKIAQRSLTFDRVRDVSTFILSAPVFACMGSAISGSYTLAFMGNLPWEKVVTTIPYWWLGNAIGTMTITPVALLVLTPILQRWQWIEGSSTLTHPQPSAHSSQLRAEKLAILCFSFAIAVLSVSETSRSGFTFQQFAFLNFIPILWASLRFGTLGGTITASLCVVATLLSYVLKYPHALGLDNFPIASDVLTVHKLSLFTQCVIGLLVGTAITQQTQIQIKLAISQVQIAEYEARSRLNGILEQTNARLEQANREKDELLAREQTAREQAETANRLKDEFLAIVSHELRTPLNPILGWSKLLQSGNLDPTATQKALETIDRNAKLQSKLIEDLLDVSRILRGKLVLTKIELDFVLLIQSAVELVRLSAEAKSISLNVTAPRIRIPIYGDPTRLQQVIGNLLTNAVKFTPEGGQVTISLESKSGKTQPDATLVHGSDYAQLNVRDTGKGIHPDFLPYVFEHFRQEDGSTTRNFGGLGLGLAIVRHLVELHHGRVEAQSQGENCGATFIVNLPQVNSCLESTPEMKPESYRILSLKGLQVLAIDDEPDARELLQCILEIEQVTVRLAASVQEALSQLEDAIPDLIISDISMPEMDGYDLIRQVRRIQPHRIPAIALTANAKAEDRLSAIAAGFDAYLAKPITPEALLQKIEEVLESRKFVDRVTPS
jgi:signal transduction histidine kinase/ActR/RegA family two-component response regulator